jgi:hypothetical protein
VGGAGGSTKAEGHFPATDFPETHYPETGYPHDTTEERFKAVARKMQECGAYRGPAFEIATTMLTAEPACTVSWAEETFYRVFNEERRRGVTAEQAMRRTITRLKNGDWGNLTDVVAEADRRRQAATPAYQQAQPRPPAEPQPSTQAAAAAVWAAVLAILKSEVPSAVYDTWLRDTTALGWDKAGMTLSVQVTDEEALEVLSTHCSEALEQALTEVLETQEPELAGAPGLLRVDFVPPGRVAEAKTTPPAEALWEEALKDIKLQVTRATFDTWLRLTQGTNLELNGQGQFLVVRAHNHYAVEWLTGKLYPLILRNVIRVAEDDFGEQIDRDSFEIQFVAASQRQ